MPRSRHTFARTQDVLKTLAEAGHIGVRFVDFTGGEPLLHPELAEMLAFAKQIGLQTSVTTNGELYPQRAAELQGLVDYLHFSLDSSEAAQHDRIRRRGGLFQRVLQSIDIAGKLGEQPDLLFTGTPDNFYEIEILAPFAKELRLILIINPLFPHLQNQSLDSSYLRILSRYRFHPYVYINTAFDLLRSRGGNSVGNSRCRVVDSTLVVGPDHDLLLPCFHFARAKIPLRNTLKEALESKVFQHFRKLQGNLGICQGCQINCYFDPSFLYRIDEYFFRSLFAKAWYVWNKKVRRPIEQRVKAIRRESAEQVLENVKRRFVALQATM